MMRSDFGKSKSLRYPCICGDEDDSRFGTNRSVPKTAACSDERNLEDQQPVRSRKVRPLVAENAGVAWRVLKNFGLHLQEQICGEYPNY